MRPNQGQHSSGWPKRTRRQKAPLRVRVSGIATPMLTREKAIELLASWEVSTGKAKKDLGFESHIPFEQGARETYKWYRESF